MKKITILFLFLGIATLIQAQQGNFSITQAVTGQYRELSPKKYYMLSWMPGTNNYTYLDFTIGKYFIGDISSKPAKEFLSLDNINPALEKAGMEKQGRVPFFDWKDKDNIIFTVDTQYVTMDIKKKSVITTLPFSSLAENQDYNTTSGFLAYTIENNLYVTGPDKKVRAISDEKNKGIVFGKTVHRSEFGISKGTFWSNSGTQLAFYRMDESMVTEYPLVDITEKPAVLKMTRYPMAGMTSHHVTVGVYNTVTGKTIYLETGEPAEQYLTNIAWDPADKNIYIAVLNRAQNHMWLRQYDATTGKFVKTLFEEENARYVEPLNPVYFIKSAPDQFIWQSQRDGFMHLYLYNTDGKVIRQLTSGDWIITSLVGTDNKDQFVYFQATKESPLERHYYKVPLAGGEITKLTGEKGEHDAVFNSTYTYFMETYSNVDVPNVHMVMTTAGKEQKTLVRAEDPMKGFNMPKMTIVEIMAADGKTKLYGRYIEPIRKDSTTKCPAIVYVYGGPHAQMVTNSWLGGAALWEYYMAQKGYAVLTLDNRGSSGRGFEFESVIHRNLGIAETDDQMKGIEFLTSKKYIDPERIGVHGWSFGGFMTTNLMTRYSKVFKVGVAGGPVMDWKYYEVMYGERYMDTPEENPEGYKNACMLDKAKDLKGKLLLIHGYIDDVVVPQNSLSFIEKCIKNKVQVDFFTYPTHEHNVRNMDRVHLMQKVTEYFDTFL
ncbi:MAG: S9 family peptidase [Bacteroidetes bacterium HGW-Bacteroidetes-21]|nr:MAG: S9 family peptidase [Bacteroidetes bacterium HGW-Bacteroidetes-21]